jgi:MFS family permease
MNNDAGARTVASSGLLGWWREAAPEARRALVAASLGWGLDAFDVMLYALVLAALMRDLSMPMATGGLLGSLTLAAAAVGGVVFGVVADRYGRTRALIGSILIYSLFTGACGLAQTIGQLALFRVLLGIGMGGEWASGATLVSETWPAEHRGKALGFVQSSWAIGYGAAVVVTAIVMPLWGWRAVFFVGVLPALLTAWVLRSVREPAIWTERQQDRTAARHRFSDIFRGTMLPLTVAVTLMNACTMFAWWGFNLWIPSYLQLPVEQGGIGLGHYAMGLLIVMQTGMWFGYVTFGFIADTVGRKRTYIIYLVSAALLIMAYTATRNPWILFALGPFVAFFGTGYFSGFAAVTAEIYPTEIRSTAQGFTYNIGRIASAVAPWTVGKLADTHGFSVAFPIIAVAFMLAALCWVWIPETKGKTLP